MLLVLKGKEEEDEHNDEEDEDTELCIELPELEENMVEMDAADDEQYDEEVSRGGGDVGCIEFRNVELLLPPPIELFVSGTLKRDVEEPIPPPTMFIREGVFDLMFKLGSTKVECKSLKRWATYFEYSSFNR